MERRFGCGFSQNPSEVSHRRAVWGRATPLFAVLTNDLVRSDRGDGLTKISLHENIEAQFFTPAL
jgi:hypothetical protein